MMYSHKGITHNRNLDSTRHNDNRIKTFIIPPLRGHIFDRNNIQLTENKKNYRVLFYKNKNTDDEVLKEFFKKLRV